MENEKVLVQEYRGGIVENEHLGLIAGVDFDGNLRYSIGNPDKVCYLRSCAKSLQCLPLFMNRFDEKFGLTDEEATLFAASHVGRDYHVKNLESIMKKLNVTEDILIMKPTYPLCEKSTEKLIREGKPRRKIYHNCSGKHLGLITSSKGLGLPVTEYWKPDSDLQKLIRKVIGTMADYPADKIVVGIDGCGVPVYGMPLKNCAKAFARLSSPEMIKNEDLRRAVIRVTYLMHKYPDLICGDGEICSELMRDSNIVAKSGAKGIYCFSLKKERLAFAIKILDGAQEPLELVVASILEQIGYKQSVIDSLYKIRPQVVINDNDTIVGACKASFVLEKAE
ncbi:MAG: asparaginase [Bacillota bacterium]|nr:asparaginase [Bacillota bacterium]